MDLEDQHRFTVAPTADVADMSLAVVCGRCGEDMFCGGLATLADLIASAAEHAEVCR
jgi:hypothetical protein